MLILKSPREIELLRQADLHTAEILQILREAVKPGVSTKDLDLIAEKEIKKRGVKSAFLGYNGFKGNICASINEEVVHGIPSPKRILKEGDIISIDFGVVYKGYVGDSAITVPCGQVSDVATHLMATTKESLKRAIACCTPDNYLSDIGITIQEYVEAEGFSTVRDYVGHGIGTSMHEDPQVPHYYTGHRGIHLREGLVIAVEPMINEGTWKVRSLSDGWTVVTKDGKLSAHFEHSIAITKDGPYVLSLLPGMEL